MPFDCNNKNKWDYSDDLRLLNAILNCGYDNWEAISKKTPPFSSRECELRYLEKFIDEPEFEELEVLKRHFQNVRKGNDLCSSNCKVSVPWSDPKCLSVSSVIERERLIKKIDLENLETNVSKLNCEESKQSRCRSNYSYNACPGYIPERSEFEIEYENQAEGMLALLSEPQDEEVGFKGQEDKELYKELQVALVQAYNFKLRERERRKKIIKTHGLLDRRKTYSTLQRYEVCKSGGEADLLLERLELEAELRANLGRLIWERSLGLRLKSSLQVYSWLSGVRAKHVSLLQRTPDLRLFPRRPSAPLTLHNLPGYSLLDEEEKELCSKARIVPETYRGFKKLLTEECARAGGLKLAQARALIKIDVNKTRKMYDHLLAKGLIWRPQ